MRKARDPEQTVTARTIGAFFAAGVVAMIAVVFGVVTLVRHDIRDGAVRGARDVTVVTGRIAIAPLLTDKLLDGDPDALGKLDKVVREQVLSDTLVRVKVWKADGRDGRIVYSDDRQMIGRHFVLSDEDLDVLKSGRSSAGVSDLREAENVSERQYVHLLQVYDALRTTPKGTPVLFEAYLTTKAIQNNSSLTSIAPAVVGGFLLLFVLEVPLLWGLARRVRRARGDRALMLERMLRIGEAERRRIAADLHDGIVQQVAGSTYSLAAAADEADRANIPNVAASVRTAASDLRQAVRGLRNTIVAITPPRLHDEGLLTALDDLASTARAAGLEVTLEVDPPRISSPKADELVLRAAQEAIRNVVAHARARHVTLRVDARNDRVNLVVIDDGRGFAPAAQASHKGDIHLGLQLLSELARDAGGELRVTSAPGAGTEVALEVPTQ